MQLSTSNRTAQSVKILMCYIRLIQKLLILSPQPSNHLLNASGWIQRVFLYRLSYYTHLLSQAGYNNDVQTTSGATLPTVLSTIEFSPRRQCLSRLYILCKSHRETCCWRPWYNMSCAIRGRNLVSLVQSVGDTYEGVGYTNANCCHCRSVIICNFAFRVQ